MVLPHTKIYDHPHHKTLDNTNLPLPKVVVLDLDYTLWPCWCDTHVATPIRGLAASDSVDPQHNLLDSKNTKKSLRKARRTAKASLKSLPAESATSDIYTSILDADHNIWEFYPEVPAILGFLKSKQVKIITASRTCTPKLAQKMLKLLHIPLYPNQHDDLLEHQSPEFAPAWDLIDHSEWGTGSKISHFQNLQRHLLTEDDNNNESSWKFTDMIFFDDEYRNIDVQHNLGVVFNLVTEARGLNWDELMRAMQSWWALNGH
ncbi:hypothetical protein NADFUDRAFT_45545 [Nadsonia fulvescens var. elongata DSM 6958]|uniref:Magnesium-dependent phosphatase-1 n=1 Tax=Nadsonia fulvescens var. elongata DSM 6958 TaxID=857566 RepID=A0A1E3PRH6_9ASCO|nr:hypothetical protein NADFUDRAFT_45545 [Nadsonia fulvescens var. elongata DSM 6958]